MEYDLTEAMDCSSKVNRAINSRQNSATSVQSPSETCSRNIIESFGHFVQRFSSNSSKNISMKPNLNVSPEMITKSLKEAFPRKTTKFFPKNTIEHCSFSVTKKISPKVKTIQKSLQRVSFARFHSKSRECFARTPGKGSLKIDKTSIDGNHLNRDNYNESSSTFLPTISLQKINNKNESFTIRSAETCSVTNTEKTISADIFRSSSSEPLQDIQFSSSQRMFWDSSTKIDHFSRSSNTFSRNSSENLPSAFKDSFANANESFSRNLNDNFSGKSCDPFSKKCKKNFPANSNEHFLTNVNNSPFDNCENSLQSNSNTFFQNSVLEIGSSNITNTFQRNKNYLSEIDKDFQGIYSVSYPRASSVISDDFPRIGDSISKIGDNSFPRSRGDSFPRTRDDSFPGTRDDSFPSTRDDSFPRTWGDSFPRTWGDSFPRTWGDSFPRIVDDSFPRIGDDSFPRIGNDSFPKPGDDSISRIENDSFKNTSNGFFPGTGNEYFPKTNGKNFSSIDQESFSRDGHQYFSPNGREIFLENGNISFLGIGNLCAAKKSIENIPSISSETISTGSCSSKREIFKRDETFTKLSSVGNTSFFNTNALSKDPKCYTEFFQCNDEEMFPKSTLQSESVYEENQCILVTHQSTSHVENSKEKIFGKPLEALMGVCYDQLTDRPPIKHCHESLEKTRKSYEKALMPMISSNSLNVDDSSLMDNLENGLPYDPNRRSSLGAESLLEHDIAEEGNMFDNEGIENLLYAEAQLGLEYADDIFNLSRNREKVFHPYNCMDDQPQVTEYMRCTLVHWLTKVNHQLKFQPETIFIAVSLTDRFLASTPIAQDCLQLLAVCALFVAAKLEESSVPGISALVSLCGKTYKHHHFRRMEKLLLSTLSFELHAPTSWFFVTHLMLKTCQLTLLDRRMLSLARDAVETCLGSYSICQFLPSEQAAVAICYSYLVLYAPVMIREISSLTSSCKDSSTELQSDEADERWKLHKILSLNSAGSSLMWVIFKVFTDEEIGNINKCLEIMTPYMEPFTQSLTMENEPNSVGNVTLLDTSLHQKRLCNSSTAKFTDNLKLLWKQKCHNSMTSASSMEVSREQIVKKKDARSTFSNHEMIEGSKTGPTFCYGQSDCSIATASRCSQCCEFCRGRHMQDCNTNSEVNVCRGLSKAIVFSNLSVLSTPGNCNEVKDKTLFKEGDIYASDFVEVNNEPEFVEEGEDYRHLINVKSKVADSKQSKLKSFFSY